MSNVKVQMPNQIQSSNVRIWVLDFDIPFEIPLTFGI
jgi:hypothetical protein